MEGVEILATSKCATNFEPNALIFILVTIFCIVSGMVLGSKNGEYGLGGAIGLLVGIVGGTIAAIGVSMLTREYYPVYKVTISDEVSMNDFMNKYEILDQEGKIYIVKERASNVD